MIGPARHGRRQTSYRRAAVSRATGGDYVYEVDDARPQGIGYVDQQRRVDSSCAFTQVVPREGSGGSAGFLSETSSRPHVSMVENRADTPRQSLPGMQVRVPI